VTKRGEGRSVPSKKVHSKRVILDGDQVSSSVGEGIREKRKRERGREKEPTTPQGPARRGPRIKWKGGHRGIKLERGEGKDKTTIPRQGKASKREEKKRGKDMTSDLGTRLPRVWKQYQKKGETEKKGKGYAE